MATKVENEAARSLSMPNEKSMDKSEKSEKPMDSDNRSPPTKNSARLSQSFKSYFTYLELLFAAQPTWVDVALIICGTLSAIGAGIPFPLMGVLFGQLIDNFNSATCAAEANSAATADPFYYEATINRKVIQTAWIGAITLVLFYGHLTCWNIISQRLAQRLRTRYVSALLRQPPAFFDTRGAAGQVSSRLNGDITAVQAGTSEKVGNIITTISFFVTVFIIAFSQQPRLAGILLCMLPAFLISGILGGKYLGKYVVKQSGETSSASSIASEALTHIAVVQAFGAAPRLEAKFASHMEKAKKFATTKAAIAAVQTGLLYFIAYSGNALAFWQGSIRIADSAAKQDGSASVGQIYAIVYLLVDACVMLGGIAPTLPFLGAAIAAYERLQEDILAPSAIDGTSNEGLVLSPSTSKSLSFRDVSFEFPSRAGQPVLQQVNLEFPAGKYTAIVGLSGSGKSTLAALMARLHDPTEGYIELDGHDLRNLNVRSLRSFISFVQQEPSLLDRCILENIALGLVNSSKPVHQHLKPFLNSPALAGLADKGKDALAATASLGPEFTEIAELVRRAAELADAASFIENLESGYGTLAGPNGSRLSGGQRQRIALARALIRDPEILVLDEATAALDSASEKRIQNAVERAAADQRTIISIAHRLSTIRNADSIVVMQAGRVIEQGTYAELMAQDQSEFARMARLQSLGTSSKAEAGSISDVSVDASTLKGGQSIELTQSKYVDEDQTEKKLDDATEKKKQNLQDRDLDGSKPFSSVMRGIGFFTRPSLGLFTVAIIAAIFVGATFTGAGVLFGFTVGALNPCETTVEKIRSMGRFFAGLYFMLAGIELIANFLAWFGFGTVAERLLYNIRVLSFRSLLEQTIHWHKSEGRDPTSLLGVITKDCVAVGAFSGSTFGTIFAVCMNILISIIVSHVFAWKIAVVCLTTVPILLGSGFLQLRMLARYEERHQKAFSTATSLATEAIQSIKTVAVLSLEQEYMDSFERLLLPPKKQVVRASVVTNIFLAISYTAGIFVNALAYWWGSQLIMRGQYTQTDFLIILVAMLTSAQLWSSMFTLAPEFSRARLALSRVMTVVSLGSSTHTGLQGRDPEKTGDDMESEIQRSSPPIQNSRGGSSVAFKNVSFAYPGRPEVKILDNISFTLPPNQFCGLVGPSGAGKSTIMNLVQRLYSPVEGAVFIDGQDISRLPAAFRETMAIVPQEPALFDGTVKFNVGLGAAPGNEATDAEIEEACRLANIHDVIISLPDGYDTECGASASSRLSGGQRQRLAIARALVRRPRLLLLDESTSALDAASEEALQRGLEKAAIGTTVLAITHRLHTVQRADVIFVVEGGQIADSGTHNELMERRESYRVNAMSQLLQ
ncbi:related to multidrug resistance protein [Rhynchosporium secalis]|uniref:Related to multidrug resistance protein n=1 Tax=Rhynchosporium secalis TaxID=38038 RepID=A0A1E1M5Y0_RHYSE|nr:related to multidrug resistance protein [Rhynchosporium secalis]